MKNKTQNILDFHYQFNPIIKKVEFGDTGNESFLLTLLDTVWSEEEPTRADLYIGVTISNKNKDEFETYSDTQSKITDSEQGEYF